LDTFPAPAATETETAASQVDLQSSRNIADIQALALRRVVETNRWLGLYRGGLYIIKVGPCSEAYKIGYSLLEAIQILNYYLRAYPCSSIIHFPLGIQWDTPQYRSQAMQKRAVSDIEFIVKWFLRLSIYENSLLLKNAQYNEIYSSFVRRSDTYLSNETWSMPDETLREREEHECMHTSAHDRSISTTGHEMTMEEAEYPEDEEAISVVQESRFASITEEVVEDTLNKDSPTDGGLMDEKSMNGPGETTPTVQTLNALIHTLPKKVEEFAERMKKFGEELLKSDPISVNSQQLESQCLQAYANYISSFMVDLDHSIVSSILRLHSHGTNREEYGTFTELRKNPFGQNVRFPKNPNSEALLMSTMKKIAEKVPAVASEEIQWLTNPSVESEKLGELAVT
jgi:hypothetical protein